MSVKDVQHIMPCMNSTEPIEIYMLPGQIGEEAEEAKTSAENNSELVCFLRTPNFLQGTHDYDPKRHEHLEGVSKCMISRQEAQAKFNEYRELQGSHVEVYTDRSKMNEWLGAVVVMNHHFQNGERICRQLSKRLPENTPSLQLRLQPSVWHWIITNTWAQFITM